jgi:chitinase
MTIKLATFSTLVLLFSTINPSTAWSGTGKTGKKPVVIGYVSGFGGRLIETGGIDVSKLTHINYAFVDIKDNLAWLHNENTDTVNLRNLTLLKQKAPELKILISIGGWSWSKGFSDAVLTDSSRQAFAASAATIVDTYNLDGVDIDWEYPNMRGDSNIFRPEDRQNYTLMFAALRRELDKIETQKHQPLLLTTAVGGFNEFLKNTEMDKVQQYLNYINLMTYDYGWGSSGHHTNLYHSKDYEAENSANKAVKEFTAAGVPIHKLVMGLAFYGRGSVLESTAHKGLQQKIVSGMRGGGYSYIKDSLINKNGYRSYWDRKAKAPYLLQKKDKKFISYENERSVKQKCRYVKKADMAGVMFWEYNSDPKGYLLTAIHQSLYR